MKFSKKLKKAGFELGIRDPSYWLMMHLISMIIVGIYLILTFTAKIDLNKSMHLWAFRFLIGWYITENYFSFKRYLRILKEKVKA